MNGNFGHAYSGGTTAPLHQHQNAASGNGYILTGRGGYRHIGPCGSRSFSTSKHSHGRCRPTPTEQPTITTTTMPTTKGFAPHPHNSYQANPGGFINGIKNIVNGFINPTLNSDFYWDHHSRHYNPKYRNNYMMDQRQQDSGPPKTAQCNASLKTVFFGLGSNATRSSSLNAEPPTVPSHSSASGETGTAIFTSDDFPALPAIKKPNHIPSYITPASSTAKPTTKSVSMRCQQQQAKPPPPVKRPNFAANAAALHDKDITCDFVVLDKPKPKICNPVSATTNACRSAANGLSAIRCRPRIRQISECSDDSFVICFSDDAPEGVLEVALDSDSDDDSDFDVDSGDSDEDDDDIDETDNHVRNSSETSQPDSGFDDGKDKKVRFNLNPKIHMMYKWDFAYRAARKGHWENFARDRQRFKNRIDILSKIISPILDTQHREKIYRIRFCDSENNANSN